jgi:ATP-dependent Clp protease ATP-binding subunit ClpA
MRACDIDVEKLRRNLASYVESELRDLVTGGSEDSKPTAGFQRVIERAVIYVQSSGREEVTGANVWWRSLRNVRATPPICCRSRR